MEINNKIKFASFLVVFIFKSFLIFLFIYFSPNIQFFPEKIYSEAGDTFSYIESMQNYITNGIYYVKAHNENYYSVRPPHYTIIYLFLQKIGLQKDASFNIIVLIQIIINSLSIVALSLLIVNITKKKYSYYLMLVILSLTTSMSYFNHYILPESLVISCTSLALYCIYKYYFNNNSYYLILASFLFAFSVQMRPYIVLSLFIPYFFILIIFMRNKDYKSLVRSSLFAFIAMSIIFTPWIYRNYKIYQKIAPYDYKILDYYYGGDYQTSIRKAKLDFLKAVGETDTYWDIKCMSSFFEDDKSRFKQSSIFKFKKYNFSKSISMDNYNIARDLYLKAINDKDNINKKNEAIDYFNYLTKLYCKEKPLNYYVFSKIRILKYMIFHNGTYFLPFNFNQSSSFSILLKLWKIGEFILYKSLLILSILGVVIGIFKKKEEIIFILIPLSVIGISLIMGIGEYRYFTLSYPVLFLFAIYSTTLIFDRIKQYKL